MAETSAQRIGAELAARMDELGLNAARLAARMDRNRDHIEAVLAGYPNSRPGRTMLDTVDAIAEALDAQLTIVPRRGAKA
jgi:hypothetical protein